MGKWLVGWLRVGIGLFVLTICLDTNEFPISSWAAAQPSSSSGSGPSSSQLTLPQEPEEFDNRELKAYYDWRNDLFFRLFDMTGSGIANYMTARRTYKVWLDDFGTPVVMTVGDPLFYWLDVNGNGEFEQELGEMWSDPDEDGVTGNERLYDSSDLQSQPSRIPMWEAPKP